MVALPPKVGGLTATPMPLGPDGFPLPPEKTGNKMAKFRIEEGITFSDETEQSTALRRVYGVVQSDVTITLENIEAKVLSATKQLQVYLNSGTWQATGWTNTYQGGSPITQYWANVPISSTGGPNGNGFTMSGAMNDQGNGCELTFSDQTNLDKTYKITVIKAGTTGNQWSITIERLV